MYLFPQTTSTYASGLGYVGFEPLVGGVSRPSFKLFLRFIKIALVFGLFVLYYYIMDNKTTSQGEEEMGYLERRKRNTPEYKDNKPKKIILDEQDKEEIQDIFKAFAAVEALLSTPLKKRN